MLAEIIRALYLYPDRSKEENLIRVGFWFISWILGFLIQNIDSSSGPTLFVFSLSIIAEFIMQEKDNFVSRIVHLFFLLPPSTLLLGSFMVWIEYKPPWENTMMGIMKKCGYSIIVFIILRGIASYLGMHTIRDKKAGKEKTSEDNLNKASDASKSQFEKAVALHPGNPSVPEPRLEDRNGDREGIE